MKPGLKERLSAAAGAQSARFALLARAAALTLAALAAAAVLLFR